MKTHIIYWAIGLLMINTLSGQVKIGDNPQSIHPASILELESNTGALVISRVTTAEMNNIVPLDGAMVYNIEEDCLHYYNGTEWVNLCEDNRITFSTLALFNPTSRDSTVVITSEDTPDGINYNFEVNKITSENIANNTVLREDLSFGIIGQQQLQDGAVTNPKLDKANIPLSGFGIPTADVSMGNTARITNLVNPTAPQDAATMSYVDARADDDITGVIFTPATNQLTVNEGTTTFSADLSALEESADIATNATNITANTTAINDHIAADGDLSDTNEIQDLDFSGNQITLSGDPTPTVIDLSAYDSNAADDFDGAWGSLTGIPAGFADDTDDDTTYAAGAGLVLTGTTFSVNNATIAPDWNNLTNVPAGFADDTDDDTTYAAGTGLALTGTTFSVNNATIAPDWNNLTNVPAGFADDTDDDTTYAAGAGLALTGTTFSVNNATIAPDWNNLTNVPAGFADDTDDDTTYAAGTGLALTGTTFSVNNATIAPDWNNLTNVPAGFADDTDDDTTYTPGVGLTLTGTQFSVTNPVVAMGKVNGDGSVDKITGTGITRNSAGNYTVTFIAARPDPNYIVQLTLLGAGPDVTIEVTGVPTINGFTVQISQLSTGAAPGPLTTTPIDAQWYFSITDF